MFKNHGAAPKALVMGLLFVLGLSACKNDTNAAEAEASATSESASESKASAGAPTDTDDLIARLENARPGLKVLGVSETAVDGITRIDVAGAGSLYSVKGTDFFFLGELYQVTETELVNISEQEKEGLREQLLATIPVDDMVVFSPEGEVKKSINVFTDVDCGYCQKLHREVPELNAMGIEVRYLAFPRAGVGSPTYNKLASAWCSDNPQDAITKLKNREQIPTNVCEGNPIEAQYHLGTQMGVRGTPSIIMEDGKMLPGYVPAADLAARLGV